MGWFSSACSFASSFVSSAISAISPAISSFAATIGPIIQKSIGVVSAVFQVLGTALGIIKPDEQIKDLGDRALQAAEQGIHPEDFSSYNEYLNEIRNFDLNPEKSKHFSEETKQMAGVAITCKSIEEKFDMRDGTAGYMAALVALNNNYFTASRLENWIKSGVDMDKAIDYFNRDLGPADTIETEEKLLEVETSKGNNDADAAYDALQEAAATVEQNATAQS